MSVDINGRFGRLVSVVSRQKWFGSFALGVMPKVDRFVNRVTGGRLVLSNLVVPTLVLTTTGAKSGLPRQSPLATLVDGDAFYVVGSSFGAEKHPAWSGNLIRTPEATVTFGRRTVEVKAFLLSDEEKAAIWPRLLKVWPNYDTYVERSGRNLRVFRLEPQA